VALRLAACSDPPVVPSGPLGVSPDPPLCPPASGPRGVSVPSGPFGVPPYSPACPPVPLVSLGSYGIICNNLVRPAAAAPFPGVLLPAVLWLSSLAVAHTCMYTYIAVAADLV
jgi:hypothetical protein